MNIDLNGKRSDISCEQCDRLIGHEMIGCPKRPQGLCPYENEVFPAQPSPNRIFLLIGIVAMVAVLWWLGSEFTLWLLFGILISLALIGTGLFMNFPGEVQLYNPDSGVKWNRPTFLGIPLNPILLTGGRRLPINLNPLRSLQFPASIIKLPDTAGRLGSQEIDSAVDVFRAAIVGLLTQGLIYIYRHKAFNLRRHRWLRIEQHIYVVRMADGAKPDSANGALEQTILKVLDAWSEGEESRKWPDGAPIYQLTLAVFMRNYSHPETRLISFVLNDALERVFDQPIGSNIGAPTERTESQTATMMAISSEREVVDDLLDQLRRNHADFCGTLGREIRKGIRSRAKQEKLDGI